MLNYTANVNVNSLKVTPTAAAGTITVNGAPVASDSASSDIILNNGQNIITIVVTEPGKSAKTYKITVTKSTPLPQVVKPTLSASGVATWINVANATSYTVQLYKGGVEEELQKPGYVHAQEEFCL